MFKNNNFNIYINITKNNTILTLTNYKGQVIAWQSAGSSDFKGSRKKGKTASITACSLLCEKVINFNIKHVNIIFKGQFNKWRRAIIKDILNSGIVIESMLDGTKIPHNGCRKRRKKR